MGSITCVCGTVFTPKRRRDARWCSKRCYLAHWDASGDKRRVLMRSWRVANPDYARTSGARRRKIIQGIKAQRGCIDCGIRDFRVLDFDHVRGVKAFGIGMSKCTSMKRLLDEIAKCEVRCSNCHRIQTYERRAGRVEAA